MYYETEAMARMRVYLESQGHSEDQVNAFKRCLITLERAGLCLTGGELPKPQKSVNCVACDTGMAANHDSTCEYMKELYGEPANDTITPIVPFVSGDAFDECTCPACLLEDSFIQIERR